MMKLFRKLFPTKETRAYRKMHRRHRRELIKLAKEDAEWDWEFLHTLVMAKIRHMYEYYSAGNNVHQTDEGLAPIIEELKHVLDLQEELDGYQSATGEPEIEKYKEIYSYIGNNLLGWWD